MSQNWPWAILLLLGAYHGLNPAMGWLFALALGLQEKRRSAVVAALFPIALGHAAAIAVAILVLDFARNILSLDALKWVVAAIVAAMGIYRLLRASHPRGAGMRVSGRELVGWSFLMASAHGAGLMLIPVLLARPMLGMSHAMAHPIKGGMLPSIRILLLATFMHTAAMLLVSGILAVVFFEFYEKIGLRILRHAWLNFDLLWAIALLIAAVAVLFL
jgi:hypothetical protein